MMFFLHLVYTILVLIIGMKTMQQWYRINGTFEENADVPPILVQNDTVENILQKIEEIPEFVSNHLPDDCCSFRVAKYINPFKDVCPKAKNVVVSVCLKCAMCLAVAEKIKSIFDDNETYGDINPKCTTEDIECRLNTVCKHGFKNYDLRNYNGFTIVTEASKDTNHVKSNLDGLWTISLQKKCSNFLQNMEVFDIYNQHKIGAIDLTNFLCRGSGIFRECQNIHFDTIRTPDEENRKHWINCLF